MHSKNIVIGKQRPEFIQEETIGDIFRSATASYHQKTTLLNHEGQKFANKTEWTGSPIKLL